MQQVTWEITDKTGDTVSSGIVWVLMGNETFSFEILKIRGESTRERAEDREGNLKGSETEILAPTSSLGPHAPLAGVGTKIWATD